MCPGLQCGIFVQAVIQIWKCISTFKTSDDEYVFSFMVGRYIVLPGSSVHPHI